jgi:hypothetical protein
MKTLKIVAIIALFALPGCGANTVRLDIDPVAEVAVATATLAPVATPTNLPELPAVTREPVEMPTLGGAAAEPTATPAPLPTMAFLPTVTLTPTPTPEPDWSTVSGRTAEGLNYLGNPQAPVTMIDFSDFM